MMRKILFALILALSPSVVWSALAAPSGLSSGPVSANSANLDWTEDLAVSQWNIYLGGVLRYQPFRSDTSVPSTSRRRFLLTNLPAQSNIVVTMRALAAGQTMSAESAALTITSSTVPITYVLAAPGQAVTVAGTFTSSTSAAAAGSNVTVTADSSTASATRNTALGSISTSAAASRTSDGLTAGFLTGSASTSALQTTGNTSLSSIDGKIVVVDTSDVGISSSVLPTGGSTSVLQTTGNASLSNIYGQQTTTSQASSQPVRLTYTPDVNNISGTISLPTGAASAVNQTTANTALASLSTTSANTFAALSSTGAAAQQVQGNVASGSATTGNPLGMGGRAATTIPTAVTDGQRVELWLTKHGRIVNVNQSIPELVTKTTTTISASVAETTILPSGGAGVFWDIDSINVINTDTSTNTRIDFRDSTAGNVIYSMGAAKAFGGFVATFPVSMVQTTAANNWTAQCSASTTDIRINVIAHQRK